MHTGIKGRQVHLLIRFYAEEPRMSPWQPAMVQDCSRMESPFPPSENGDCVRNRDVPYLSVTTSYVVTT